MPVLDRAITSAVAEQLRVSLDEAEEAQFARSRVDRFLNLLIPLSVGPARHRGQPAAAHHRGRGRG